MRAGGDDDVIHVRHVILAGDFGLFLRVHLAIVHTGAGVDVLGGQILEGGVPLLRETDDIHVFLELAHGALGLIGERIELLAGEVDALFMAIAQEVDQTEDHEHQESDGEHVGAKTGGPGGEKCQRCREN